jgi:hypothetical protein
MPTPRPREPLLLFANVAYLTLYLAVNLPSLIGTSSGSAGFFGYANLSTASATDLGFGLAVALALIALSLIPAALAFATWRLLPLAALTRLAPFTKTGSRTLSLGLAGFALAGLLAARGVWWRVVFAIVSGAATIWIAALTPMIPLLLAVGYWLFVRRRARSGQLTTA